MVLVLVTVINPGANASIYATYCIRAHFMMLGDERLSDFPPLLDAGWYINRVFLRIPRQRPLVVIVSVILDG
jgi:hypothetical protein